MKRESWIDALRGIAITAVVLDHALYFLPAYRNNLLWRHTFFSIPWLVFLSGIANTLSSLQKKWIFPKSYFIFWKKRLLGIYLPFIFATIIIHFFLHQQKIKIAILWPEILNFSVQPSFYFINLILQLYILFPFLFSVLNYSKRWWQQMIVLIVVFIYSFFIFASGAPPMSFTRSAPLFGGQLLFTFFLGMLYKQVTIFHSIKRLFLFLIYTFALTAFIIYEVKIFKFGGEFLRFINYDSLIWSASLLVIIKKVIDILEKKKISLGLLKFLGQHSLFIYLFHYFFLGAFIYPLSPGAIPLFYRIFPWQAGFVVIVVLAVILSLIMEYIFQMVVYLFRKLVIFILTRVSRIL